jgi:vancomycin resistance protein VanJ
VAETNPNGEQTSGVQRQATPGRRRLVGIVLAGLAWLYLALVLGLWLVLRTASDRWWPATLLLFGPRWVWLLPLAVLALTSLV